MREPLPSYYYADPCEVAIRNEEKKCTGCKNLCGTLGREFCGIGKRVLVRCNRFKEKA